MYIAMYIATFLAWDSLSLADCYLWRGRVHRDGYRIKLLPGYTVDVGVSLHPKTHSLFMWHINGSVMHTSIRACFLCFSTIPIIYVPCLV